MPTRTQQADLLSCAYASHGDTKHVLLFPEDPHECFDFAAAALDLADRLQTPIFVMTDLDIGMNHRLCEPLAWDDSRRYDRGKVMTADELEAGKDFGRYLDVDGDGIPYRTLPGTHPSRGAYFTRGTTRDAYARYSEAGPDYLYNVDAPAEEVRDREGRWCRSRSLRKAARETRFGVDLLRLDQPGDGRGVRRAAGATASTSTRCACARFRSAPRSIASSPSTRRCSSSSRTATRSCA